MRLQGASSTKPTVKPTMQNVGKAVTQGYGMKHKLRKGTEFQGMNPADTGVGDLMSDYARVAAAKGGI